MDEDEGGAVLTPAWWMPLGCRFGASALTRELLVLFVKAASVVDVTTAVELVMV